MCHAEGCAGGWQSAGMGHHCRVPQRAHSASVTALHQRGFGNELVSRTSLCPRVCPEQQLIKIIFPLRQVVLLPYEARQGEHEITVDKCSNLRGQFG